MVDKANVEEKQTHSKAQQQSKPDVEASASEENVNEQKAAAPETGNEKEGVKEKAEDFKSKFFYLAAEMENMKKRFDRERQDWLKFGNEKILSSLLEVVDNLDHSYNAIANDKDEKVKNLALGIDMVRKQFLDVLGRYGLTSVEAVGKKFDPKFHQAMTQKEDKSKTNEEIISEFQKGYMLNGRLLRPSKVVIVKN